jgi:holo-[acyl-carrier protein] synthase
MHPVSAPLTHDLELQGHAALRTGVDMIEVRRVEKAIATYGDRFLNRVYTPAELALCQGKAASLAARFAAKEAVGKALGTGLWRQGVNWTQIEVLRDAATGAPYLVLHRAAAAHAQRLGLSEWSVSLSHARRLAIALIVALAYR